MFGDSSYRTKQVATSAIILFLLTVIGTACVILMMTGELYYRSVINSSSTAKGSTLTFERSDASIVLEDIYTTPEQDVLVARFSSDTSANLPFRGTDYRVFIESDSLSSRHEEMDIIFGRMSTDGDLFLVIPKPTKDIYSVFIMNTNYIPRSISVGDVSSSQLRDIEAQLSRQAEISITDALRTFNYTQATSSASSYRIEHDEMDMVSLRLTLDPASSEPQYAPFVVDAELIDDTNTFRFDNFFDTIFKNNALRLLEREHENIGVSISQNNRIIEHLEDLLTNNPNDANAQSSLAEARGNQSALRDRQVEVATRIVQIGDLSYDPSVFRDIQTKARIIELD